MGNFNKGGKSFGGGKKFGGGGDRGGNRSFGGDRGGNRSFGGDRGGRDRAEMHKATCSDCGKSCEVPFRPTGEKPVFCSECFGDKRGNSSDRGNDRNSKPRFDNKKSFQGGGDSQNYKAQFDALNVKLDRILKALDPNVSEELEGYDEVAPEAKQYKEFKKAPKKEVDTVALKEALANTSGKKVSEKAPAKKVVAKKVVAKKAPAKKVVAKKAPAKKVAAKKAPAKKK